jgi:hypothetical protein
MLSPSSNQDGAAKTPATSADGTLATTTPTRVVRNPLIDHYLFLLVRRRVDQNVEQELAVGFAVRISHQIDDHPERKVTGSVLNFVGEASAQPGDRRNPRECGGQLTCQGQVVRMRSGRRRGPRMLTRVPPGGIGPDGPVQA